VDHNLVSQPAPKVTGNGGIVFYDQDAAYSAFSAPIGSLKPIDSNDVSAPAVPEPTEDAAEGCTNQRDQPV
jgi:hypothetical protein